MREKQLAVPDNTAVRVALWRALHVEVDSLPWWIPVHWLGFLRYPPIGTEIVLYSADLEHSRASLVQAGLAPGAIVLQSWGDRDFRITDPDGYYLRISEGAAVPLDP